VQEPESQNDISLGHGALWKKQETNKVMRDLSSQKRIQDLEARDAGRLVPVADRKTFHSEDIRVSTSLTEGRK
jgi:hypothetical protein